MKTIVLMLLVVVWAGCATDRDDMSDAAHWTEEEIQREADAVVRIHKQLRGEK